MAEPGRVHDDVAEVGSARAGVVMAEGARLIRSYIARTPRTFTTAVIGASLYAVMLVVGTEIIGRATDEVPPDDVLQGSLCAAAIPRVDAGIIVRWAADEKTSLTQFAPHRNRLLRFATLPLGIQK